MQTYQPKKPAGITPYSTSNHYPICSFPLKASADLSEEPTIRLISFLASFTTLQSMHHESHKAELNGFGGSGRVETAPRRRKKNMSLKSGCFLWETVAIGRYDLVYQYIHIYCNVKKSLIMVLCVAWLCCMLKPTCQCKYDLYAGQKSWFAKDNSWSMWALMYSLHLYGLETSSNPSESRRFSDAGPTNMKHKSWA